MTRRICFLLLVCGLSVLLLVVTSSVLADKLVQNGTAVFVQQGDFLHHIPNVKSFECLGYKWNDVKQISNTDMARLKIGEELADLSDGRLIKGKSSNTVFMMSGCQRRAFPDAETFQSMGLDFGNVQLAPDWLIKALKEGPPYTSVKSTPIEGRASNPDQKNRKVECVFSRPHIVVENRTGHPVNFQLSGNFRLDGNEGKCINLNWQGVNTTSLTIPPHDGCKLYLEKEEGEIINKIEALDAKTYVSTGAWDVFACCRHTGARTDATAGGGGSEGDSTLGAAGEGSGGGNQGGWQAALNDAIRGRKYNGTAWRAYHAVFDEKGLNVWTRDKDSNIPFSARTGWESLSFDIGRCSGQ